MSYTIGGSGRRRPGLTYEELFQIYRELRGDPDYKPAGDQAGAPLPPLDRELGRRVRAFYDHLGTAMRKASTRELGHLRELLAFYHFRKLYWSAFHDGRRAVDPPPMLVRCANCGVYSEAGQCTCRTKGKL